MGRVDDYRELRVYRAAFALRQRVFEESRGFPASERYSLTDQVRRSSRSVGANIAEAWKKRRYPAHFVSKLSDADAELAETRRWLHTAEACHYLDAETRGRMARRSREIGMMLGTMIRDADRWCSSKRAPDSPTH